MSNNSALDKYYRAIDQKQEDVKARLQALRRALVRENAAVQNEQGGRVIQALDDLASMFHAQDLPDWVSQIRQKTAQLCDSEGGARGENAERLLELIVNYHSAIHRQSLRDHQP